MLQLTSLDGQNNGIVSRDHILHSELPGIEFFVTTHVLTSRSHNLFTMFGVMLTSAIFGGRGTSPLFVCLFVCLQV